MFFLLPKRSMEPIKTKSIATMAAAATKATCFSVMDNEKAKFPTPVVVDAVFPGGGALGTVVALVCIPDVEDVDSLVLEEEELVEEDEELEVCNVNEASSKSEPLRTIEAGLFAPEYEPPPVPLHPLKSQPELEEAESESDCESLYHPDDSDRFPEFEGLMLRVT